MVRQINWLNHLTLNQGDVRTNRIRTAKFKMNPEEAKKVVQDLQNNYGYVYCLTFSNGKQEKEKVIYSVIDKFLDNDGKSALDYAI